jgi:hypothetical protein
VVINVPVAFLEVLIGLPSHLAPHPAIAENISSKVGLYTTPTTS